jgi:hypothetical protein
VHVEPAPARPTPPPPTPTPADPEAELALAKIALGHRLAGTQWSWPDRSIRKPWFVLNADRTLTPAWHKDTGWWEVASPSTIRGVIMSSPRTPQTFLVDLQAGTLTNTRSNEVHHLMK